MYISKMIMHDVILERHELTKQLRLDMFDMKKSPKSRAMINYYEGRMLGMVAAYLHLGIIDYLAHQRYINIIVDAAWEMERENEKHEV